LAGNPTIYYLAPWICVLVAPLWLACCTGSAPGQAEPVATAQATTSRAPHPLDPALNIACDSLGHIRVNVVDYTAIMTKRCRVHGRLNDHQQAFVKIRNRRVENGRAAVPMSVYMKFRYPDAIKGREVIWIEGQNGGKLVAHDTGIKGLIRVSLDPNGAIAMRGQRYPITEIGLENLVQKLIEKGDQDRQHGDCQVTSYAEATVAGRRCLMFQIDHPVKRPYFDFYRAQVFFDHELRMPVRYASWSWPAEQDGEPVLEEEYTYTDVRINVGLTDIDFDPDNSVYDF
jgi:hypothetical protein